MNSTVGIGLLGCGTVGADVADRLLRDRDVIGRRCGIGYELCGVAIRDVVKRRPSALHGRLPIRDARAIVDDPAIDVVIELIGGTSDAAELVERALTRGRHVITANKDLLATQGPRLAALAASRGASLRFEAAVAGAIPLVRTLDDALAGDEVLSVAGVVSGTCNAVLSAMENGASFDDAVALAQRLGYAEARPDGDVEGLDAAHKLALIAQVAFGIALITPRIRYAGIRSATEEDVVHARSLGMRIRLVAGVVRSAHGAQAEVGPVLVAHGHEFARARGAQNVVHVRARDAGLLTLSGAGAGGAATSSAVLGDVVHVLRDLAARCDFRARSRQRTLEPALNVTPLFSQLAPSRDFPRFRVWDESILGLEASPRLAASA